METGALAGVIPQYTVPAVAEGPAAPASPAQEPAAYGGRRPRTGGNPGDSQAQTLIALAVVLVIVVAAVVWHQQNRARPDCRRYSGDAAAACAGLTRVCGPDRPCLNAVAHCMPFVDRLGAAEGDPRGLADALGGPELRECVPALTKVDPRFVAGVAAAEYGSAACTPPELAAVLADPRNYQAATRALEAVAPLAPYSLAVARALPPCPARPRPPVGAGGPGW